MCYCFLYKENIYIYADYLKRYIRNEWDKNYLKIFLYKLLTFEFKRIIFIMFKSFKRLTGPWRKNCMVRMVDVTSRAGVSVATVSNYI